MEAGGRGLEPLSGNTVRYETPGVGAQSPYSQNMLNEI